MLLYLLLIHKWIKHLRYLYIVIKKSGIILVVLLYLVTATGFALNLHFCGNVIESVKIDAPSKKCGMDSKCCKETHLEVKVKDAHQASHTVFTGTFLVSLVPVFSFAFSQEPLTINHLSNLHLERGPPPNPVPVFIQNCTFRI
ncbi:hypothetical protein [uncultured Mucilaginibacter sp.]|uniref:HYC_CC_PP family protein n=1 Tax=uncultured Mucilaginibacter sp. TaxID=797541 RepID=UPI002627FCD3|nr:hypothetical protein [uncultured Mucilaginibacter sp.]